LGAFSGLSAASCSPTVKKSVNNKIVSTTLCSDSYLFSLPELNSQYGAFSWQAASSLSLLDDKAAYPRVNPDLESLVAYGGSKIITGPDKAPLANPDIHLEWGEDFETVWQNLAAISGSLDIEDPSPRFQARLYALRPPEHAPQILYLNRAGGTAGPDTFVDAGIQAAGGINIIENPGWQTPDIETLIELNPDVIVTSFLDSNYIGVSDRLTRHAALSEKLKRLPQIHIPGKYWPCAGPGLVEAASLLSEELHKL